MRVLRRLGITIGVGAAVATVVVFGSEKLLNTRLPGSVWLAFIGGGIAGVEGHYAYLRHKRRPVENVRKAVDEVLDSKIQPVLQEVRLTASQVDQLSRSLKQPPPQPDPTVHPFGAFQSPFDEIEDVWEGKDPPKANVSNHPSQSEIDWI